MIVYREWIYETHASYQSLHKRRPELFARPQSDDRIFFHDDDIKFDVYV